MLSVAVFLVSEGAMAQQVQQSKARQEPGTAEPEAQANPEVAPPAAGEQKPISLYCNVKYKDLNEMAPCATPLIIEVKDPCACHDACGCCTPPCVHVKICVPCGCPVITCSKNGDRIRYDYGKYAVDVRVKKGFIEVDYQD
jgi:hypothetical protein